MTTVLPAAPIAPSSQPTEPRPSLDAKGDDESFAHLLDQHTAQRSTKESAAPSEAPPVDDAEEIDTAISQKDDDEDDSEDVDVSLLAPQPNLPSHHAPVLLPLDEHPLFSPELLNGLHPGRAEADGPSAESFDAEAPPIPKTPLAEKASISSAPGLALLTAMFPTPMAQLQAQWTPAPLAPTPQGFAPQASVPQPPVARTLGVPTTAPLSSTPQLSTPQTPTLKTTPVPAERFTASVEIAASGQMLSEAARLPGKANETLPAQNSTAAPVATPRVPEQSPVQFVSPPEIAAMTTTSLPTDGQNLPEVENSPQSWAGENSVALPAPRDTSEFSAPVAPAPTAALAASGAAPEATPKVSEQTRAQIPRGTPAAKRGEVMPNSALQAPPTLQRASSAVQIETPVEARPATRMASAPTAPTIFADAPATAISSDQIATPERGERNFERPHTSSDTQLEIDTAAADNGPTTRPDFENLRTEVTAAPNSTRDEATISRTEMTHIIDRTTDAAVRMRAVGTERIEVAVQLESGAKLTIQLRMANGEVTPFIRTNSEALRTALEQNWSHFSERSADRSVRLTPPVFDVGQSASNMTDLSQQRHGRDTSHADRQVETFHFNARRPQVAPATANGPTRIAPATDGLNLYA